MNRFFGMVKICRKVCMARLLHTAERLYPADYARIAPLSWWVGVRSWSAQLAAHRKHAQSEAASRAYIVKPDNGCQGAGIELVSDHAELVALLARPDAPKRAVVQEYLERPLLLGGRKFDLRLYVVLTDAAPLRAYLCREGLARFASHQWAPVDASNQHDALMHLSNASINGNNKIHVEQLWEAPLSGSPR